MSVIELGINIGTRNLLVIESMGKIDERKYVGLLTLLEDYNIELFEDEIRIIQFPAGLKLVCYSKMIELEEKTQALLSYALIDESTNVDLIQLFITRLYSLFTNRYSLKDIFFNSSSYFNNFKPLILEILGTLNIRIAMPYDDIFNRPKPETVEWSKASYLNPKLRKREFVSENQILERELRESKAIPSILLKKTYKKQRKIIGFLPPTKSDTKVRVIKENKFKKKQLPLILHQTDLFGKTVSSGTLYQREEAIENKLYNLAYCDFCGERFKKKKLEIIREKSICKYCLEADEHLVEEEDLEEE